MARIQDLDFVVYDLGSASVPHLKAEVTRRVRADGKTRSLFVGETTDHKDLRRQRTTAWAIVLHGSERHFPELQHWTRICTRSLDNA